MKRGRAGLISLTSMLTALVVIAACTNQWVTDFVIRHTSNNSQKFVVRVIYSGLTYQWRFSPKGGSDPDHFLSAQYALIGATILGTGLLVLMIARGVVTFGRVFVGTWLSVIVATQLGAIARGFVLNPKVFGSSLRRPDFAFFGSVSPNGSTFLGSVGLGLVVGLVAGLVAVIFRRHVGTLVRAEEVRHEPFLDPQSQPRQGSAAPWADPNVAGGAAAGAFAGRSAERDYYSKDRDPNDRDADGRDTNDRAASDRDYNEPTQAMRPVAGDAGHDSRYLPGPGDRPYDQEWRKKGDRQSEASDQPSDAPAATPSVAHDDQEPTQYLPRGDARNPDAATSHTATSDPATSDPAASDAAASDAAGSGAATSDAPTSDAPTPDAEATQTVQRGAQPSRTDSEQHTQELPPVGTAPQESGAERTMQLPPIREDPPR